MPLHPQLTFPPKMVQRIEQAFMRLHQLLCLIERDAALNDIDRAERAYRRSLQKLDVSEHDLVRHYPKFRFAMLARQAAANLGTGPAVVELAAEALN